MMINKGPLLPPHIDIIVIKLHFNPNLVNRAPFRTLWFRGGLVLSSGSGLILSHSAGLYNVMTSQQDNITPTKGSGHEKCGPTFLIAFSRGV